MKIHARKKLYRRMIKQMAKEGQINDTNGRMINRSSAKDNSMRRDYYPQNKV